jgi:hypothetical protein
MKNKSILPEKIIIIHDDSTAVISFEVNIIVKVSLTHLIYLNITK